VAAAVGVAGQQARSTATAHGWIEDGYDRLLRDAFWSRFDENAPMALGGLAAALALLALVRRRMPDRHDLALPLVVVLVATAVRAAAAIHDATCPHRPNVILVSIDTLRADRLGTYGYARPTSPTLDARLTTSGVVFENAWSQSPKTTPSHMTMLTSLYPSAHGIGLWDGSGSAPALNPRVHTLAEILKNAGYATAAFTAGAHMHRDRGFVQGFDVYKHGSQLSRALDYLRGHRGRPFFLFFHTYEVHDPYTPPPALAAAFATAPVPAIAAAVEAIRAGVPGWSQAHKRFWAPVDARDPRHVRYVSDLYDAGIRRMDDSTLTALLDALDALGLADDTLLIVTSDHGEAFQEHGRFLHDDLHRETLHVPLVMRFPSRLPAGRRVPQAVGLVDLLPTILDLLLLPVPAQAQGASVAALATGAEEVTAPAAQFAEYSTPGHRLESIRRDGALLVREQDDLTLYDTAADPSEQSALAAGAMDRGPSLARALEAWHAENVAVAARLGPRQGDVATPSAETVDQLRALGYVE
jgi:arylsulfatase A-like enzyme